MKGKEYIESINVETLEPAEKKVFEILKSIVGQSDIDESKTIKGAYEKMYESAKKSQKDGCYCMTDEEASKIIAEYYGIEIGKSSESNVISLEDLI